ncbi:MAG: hypothetical protein AABZ09_11125 [Candidatus Binatota bacterium]
MPILKMVLKRMLFADALPVPFSVAIEMLRSLIAGVSIGGLVVALLLPAAFYLNITVGKDKKP